MEKTIKTEDYHILEHVGHRGCGISTVRGVEDLTGQAPELTRPDLASECVLDDL